MFIVKKSIHGKDYFYLRESKRHKDKVVAKTKKPRVNQILNDPVNPLRKRKGPVVIFTVHGLRFFCVKPVMPNLITSGNKLPINTWKRPETTQPYDGNKLEFEVSERSDVDLENGNKHQ